GSSHLLYPLLLAAIGWGIWSRQAVPLRFTRSRMIAAVCVFLVVGTLLTAVARARRERERVQVYGSFYSYLEQHAPARDPVAYLHSVRSYLFYGRRIERSLVYAPLAATQSLDEWLAALRRQHIRIVAIGPWRDDETYRATVQRLASAGSAVVGQGH